MLRTHRKMTLPKSNMLNTRRKMTLLKSNMLETRRKMTLLNSKSCLGFAPRIFCTPGNMSHVIKVVECSRSKIKSNLTIIVSVVTENVTFFNITVRQYSN